MIIDEILNLKEEYIDEINKYQNSSHPIILFGAGCTSQFIVMQLNKMEIYPNAFCDNNNNKVGKKVAGLPVINIEQLKNNYSDAEVYITTQLYYEEIKLQLIHEGFQEEQISKYDIIFQLSWEKEYIKYCIENKEDIEHLYGYLADDESRRVLWNRLAFFRTRNRQYVVDIRNRNKEQYFENEIINFDKITTFVDLGMYTGDTIIKFSNYCKNEECEIWGFEPDRDLYNQAKGTLEKAGLRNVHLVPLATSDEDGVTTVNSSLGEMQSIASVDWNNNDASCNTFETCKLDTFFKDAKKKIDFIKMDIEGAEMPTLVGGSLLLKRTLPIIAVCVYHKREDLLEITNFIKALSSDYQIYLRHYSDNQTETVCYAIKG